jgi:guanine deaminase
MQKSFALVRGHILSLARSRPELEETRDGGLLIDEEGVIRAKGEFLTLHKEFPSAPVRDHAGSLILPSFIDTHIHFPQLDMMGSCAEELLLWLQRYTFPREAAFRGRNEFVQQAAKSFVDELVSNGTSTAVVYSSSCGEATDVLFEEFERRGIRGIIGKTSMDRHCPPEIAVGSARDRAWTEELISRWHGKSGRLFYALTPRFAPSCTPELMIMLSGIHKANPSLYVQTHYAENINEIAWVKELFPESRSYLDVYDARELLGPKTILAHSIHTDCDDEKLLLKRAVVIAHCPTSNLFLGSGLFQARSYLEQGQRVTLGTDVGAGTSFSQWQTMNEAYKVAQLRGERVSPVQLFSLATASAAEALGFSNLGRLEAGYGADYQVINSQARGILHRHLDLATSPEERLAALIHFADDRSLTELRVAGREVYRCR